MSVYRTNASWVLFLFLYTNFTNETMFSTIFILFVATCIVTKIMKKVISMNMMVVVVMVIWILMSTPKKRIVAMMTTMMMVALIMENKQMIYAVRTVL